MGTRSRSNSSYVPKPTPPLEIRAKYQAILEVLAGKITVTEGARRTGLSRNHFQTLMHRGLEGMMEGIRPKSPGRPRKAPRAQRAAESDPLERENRRLQQRVDTIDRLLHVASGILRDRIKLTGRGARQSRPRKTTTPSSGGSEDPGGERWASRMLTGAQALRRLGLSAVLIAAVVGVSPATLRRWQRRSRLGLPLVAAKGPGPRAPVAPEAARAVETRVRQLKGLIGAEALRHTVLGVSRRQALAIKRDTLTKMERERVAARHRVVLAAPGIIRGFDAMHALTTEGRRYLLVAGDAAVPYRTSVGVVPAYDGSRVAHALERDFREHGAPLVLRLDRASCHRTPEVQAILDRYGVLALYGPPRYPWYYGQLERQNREHRAWLRSLGVLRPELLEREAAAMPLALNALWPRSRLSWLSAKEAWDRRPAIAVDRLDLREEVAWRSAELMRRLPRADATDVAQRLAIERALMNRGYLRLEAGGWC